jgi:hypothetical protein
MEIRVPQIFVYETEEAVPVADIVTALLAAEQLFRDTAPILECCFPGVTIERVSVSVKEIAQNSPLREILYATVFLTYQSDLEKDVPAVIKSLTGSTVPDHYHRIVTIVFCLLLFYGADFVYNQISKAGFSRRLRGRFHEFAKELSAECGISEERIHKLLEDKFGKSRTRVLAHSAINFFLPSKHQNNAPILIGSNKIDQATVAEVPSDAQIEEASVPEITKPFDDVVIELHAQDIDHARQGWAAIIPAVGPKRIRMELYPPIKPDDLYTKKRIRADIMVVYTKRSDGSYKPAIAHLMNLKG